MTYMQMAQQQIEQAKVLLREKPINSTLVERWFLLKEAYDLYAQQKQPIALARSMEYILERASLPVSDCDILLGRYDDHVPTEEEETRLQEIWATMPIRSNNPITDGHGGHLTLEFGRLAKIGLNGHIAEAQDRLTRLHKEGGSEEQLVFVESMLDCYRAISHYILRYAEAAEQAGRKDCAAVCRHVANETPRTFREAMQLILMVFTVYTVYVGRVVGCLTFGRLDVELREFYERDIRAGILDEEEAGAIIDDFNCKANLHLGRGEHQMAEFTRDGNTTGWVRNPAYDSPTYVVIGGRGTVGNPLTRLFAQHITVGFKNPVYIYRWDSEKDEDAWQTVCDRVRQNASILIYNDTTMIPAMEHIGVSAEEAEQYTIHACNWPDIAGGNAVMGQTGLPMPVMLMQAISDENGLRSDIGSMEDVYRLYADYYRAHIREWYDKVRKRFLEKNSPKRNTLSLNDCFQRGPLEAACCMLDGGAKYMSVYNQLINVGTAADIVAAMEDVIFLRRICTVEEMSCALRANFEGYDSIYAACRQAPKYGTDHAVADAHAARLLNTMVDILDEESIGADGVRDIYSLNVMITDMNHVRNGATLGATPDGRLAGAPLSENLSPTVGYSKGVTSLLNSVARMPFECIHSGALNLRLHGSAVRGEAGLSRLRVLLDTYFSMGGMQAQVSIADTAMLRAAQKNPESYRDLMVRITGYSAIFTDMSVGGQNEIIRREEMQ